MCLFLNAGYFLICKVNSDYNLNVISLIFVKIDLCEGGFNLVSASSDGVAADCTSLGGGGGYTLDTCKQKTCEENSTAFNYQNGECYYKQCDDTSDIQLTNVHGGWDIYAIQGLYQDYL